MKKIYLLVLILIQQMCLAQAPTNGLIAYYPFNGNANDESGNGNHGTVHGATLITDRFGDAAKAYSFDGINNYISVPSSISLNSPSSEISISAWTKFTDMYLSSNGFYYSSIICKGTTDVQYRIQIGKQNNNTYNIFSSVGVNTSIELQNGSWYHLLLIQKNGFTYLYINGLLIDQSNEVSSISSSNSALYIGFDPPGLIEYQKGEIDDIRIYNRALTDTEVAQLYAFESNSSLNDVSIHNLAEPINKSNYVVPKEATIHHYYLAKSTETGMPVPNVVVNYSIGLNPTLRTSLPSDEDGLIDLNIKTGGENPANSTDDWVGLGSYPVQFHSLATGTITGQNYFQNNPFQIQIIDKAPPIDKEIGVGIGFEVSAAVFSAGKSKKIDVGPFKLNSGVKAGLNLGASADKFIRIKPSLENTNIWDVYFNGGIGTSVGLEAEAGFELGNKNIKIGANVSAETEMNGAVRFEKGYRFDLTNRTDVFKLGYLLFSTQAATGRGKLVRTIFENLYNAFSNTPIHNNSISSSREFAYGASASIGGEVEAKLKIRPLNLPGYGNIPEAAINTNLTANGAFIDNLIFETRKGDGKTTTNSLVADYSVIGAFEGMINLTKGNRINNPSVKSQPFEFFNISQENGIIVSRTIGWNGVPKRSFFSLTSKQSDLYLNPSKPANKYNITFANNYEYGSHSTSKIFSGYNVDTSSLQINSMAKFITLNNNSLVGSAWATVGVSGSLYQQAYDLNNWVCTNSDPITPLNDIDMNTTRDISLVQDLDFIFEISEMGIDITPLKFDSWKTYTHEFKRSVYSRTLQRALLTVDYPNVVANLVIPETHPLEDLKNAFVNAITSVGNNVLASAKSFISSFKETVTNNLPVVLTNYGGNRTTSSGQIMYDKSSWNTAQSTSNIPSVFTFTIPVNTFNTNTKLNFDFYYPENEVVATTLTDTFRIISDVFTLEALFNNSTLTSSPNSDFTIETVFSSTDLALASLPSNLIPKVLFLPHGSTIWEEIGAANTLLSFNRLGTYGLGVKISNDITPPTISVVYPQSFNSSSYIDVTVADTQSGIDWAKTTFASNNSIIPISRIGNTNTFRVSVSNIPTNEHGVYTFYVSTIDFAGNVKNYSNVYPCDKEIIIQSLELDTENPILRKALHYLQSNTQTPLSKDVYFKAGRSIELKPGFETNNKTFKAEIGGCL